VAGSRRRTRICYVLPLFDPQTEQHFYYLYGFLTQLARRADLFLIVERATAPVTIPGLQHCHVQRCRVAPLRALEILLVMARAVLLGYDRVYTHYSTFGGAASVLCRWWLGARAWYWNCEENAGHFLPLTPSVEVLKTKVRVEWPTALVIRLVSTLVTGTPTMARYYRALYGIGPRRVAVLPSWFDPGRFHPGDGPAALRERLALPEGAPVALFVHRLAPRKGTRELAAIVGLLASRLPELVWVVCGDGPDRGWLETELGRAGHLSRVRFCGNVPNRQIGDYYRLADIMVMPSRQEGLPRVLLEAQACGLPCVATDVGGVGDVVGTTTRRRVLAPRGDAGAIAGCIEQVLRSPELRRTLRDEGLENVKQYTPDRFLERFLAILTGPEGA
jgi:glycosyltransferase involved in cell wall biosynthesis